jgi:ABC-type tungstate transport system permease subunit
MSVGHCLIPFLRKFWSHYALSQRRMKMDKKKWCLIKWLLVIVLSIIVTLPAFAGDECKAVYGTGAHSFSLATGSPGELGMLKAISEVSNEFYIVGPKDDPANIANAKSAAEAYANIAKTRAKFFSRGDNSGTHKKEMAIWKQAGIQPAGDWYRVTKTFMMATLKQANEQNGYFMTDSSTWVAGKKEIYNIKILFHGDPFLINTYHTLCQPEGATAGQPYAAKFIDFIVSEEGQSLIRSYGVKEYGEGLYNDAAYARQYDH